MKTNHVAVDIEFIRSYMKVKGYTEQQFAAIIGVTHSTLNRVLNGKRGAGKKVIFGILSSCSDVSMNQLLSNDPKLPKGNKKTKTA
jgi:transcriptional regulator with XRE-family HTH domain